jgi:alpha-beta hydrolase superfamily lysophospholipase
MDTIEVEGLCIAYERVGAGPPFVLLHGVLGDSRLWTRQLNELSDEFTVIAWYAPGCGRSSDPPETFRMPEFADCLAAFVDVLGLGRPHVLGLSWGGGLALELYGRGIPRSRSRCWLQPMRGGLALCQPRSANSACRKAYVNPNCRPVSPCPDGYRASSRTRRRRS